MSLTLTTFILLATVMCGISALMTEGIKTWFTNCNKSCSPNLIALINSIVVGAAGTSIAYVLAGIAFTLPNILCILIMVVIVWLGSMIGYDKVMQMVSQLSLPK